MVTYTMPQQKCSYLLTQAGYLAIQLIWACVASTSILRISFELQLSAHLPISEGWTADMAFGFCFVVPMAGFEPKRVNPTRSETLCLNH